MNPTPEIAPEIRGLLEEIVADPRSTIRLVPRAPLRQWFDRGESLRTADVARTRAERQLIEVHREELAWLLREAARIAYWKAPIRAHSPVEDHCIPDPTEEEPVWRKASARFLPYCREHLPEVGLLQACLSGIQPESAHALAVASLALAPREDTRFIVAASVPWETPHTGIRLLKRLASRPTGNQLRSLALLALAARLCVVGQYWHARALYRASRETEERPVVGRCYALNLSLLLAEQHEALEEAEGLQATEAENADVLQAALIIKEWSQGEPTAQREKARQLSLRISHDVAPSAATICEALQ